MSDEEYEIPLQDQRVFGAGLKRKRIHFVPSTASSSVQTSPPSTPANAITAGDRYLSIVLSKSDKSNRSVSEPPCTNSFNEEKATDHCSTVRCEICALPLLSAPEPFRLHEASIAHQVCLKHSHPPSHLDRSRLGLRYLKSQGWDPDSRLGLGVQGQGIQFPIKAKPKDDKLGLGLIFPDLDNEKKIAMAKKAPKEKLDAGKIRKLEEKDRRRRQRLQEMFYRNDDVERYLGTE